MLPAMSARQKSRSQYLVSDSPRLSPTVDSTPDTLSDDEFSASTEVMHFKIGPVTHHNDQVYGRQRQEQEPEEHHEPMHGNNEQDDQSDEEESTMHWQESGEVTKKTFKERDLHAHVDQLSHELKGSLLDVTQSAPDSWLEKCRKAQDLKFPHQVHQKYQQGIWELDLLHKEHECYNAHLFATLEPSTMEERRLPAPVFGYGRVTLRVHDAKTSSQSKFLSLENVKYIQAPQSVNHRVGLGALPETVHLHLPDTTVFDVQGDGFLSISNGVGCALGLVDQGGRRVWKLRTSETSPATRATAIVSKVGSLFGWGGDGQRFKKRQCDVGDDEVSLQTL